jgi:uncharacterized protein (DUF952 family)
LPPLGEVLNRVLIYKILRPEEWSQFQSEGRFDGSADDLRDGFIHCSTREQVVATASRFFSDEPELVVLALDTGLLVDDVRWEPGSNGELFPHVYASIPAAAIARVAQVSRSSALGEAL